jgi:HAT1-interacting factor 1
MDAPRVNKASASLDVAAEGTKEQLNALIKRAAAKDLIKDYNAAVELYSEATELQAKLNGEMSLDNADLLFAYGKALYNVAISKSDVLGSKVAGKAQPDPVDQPTGSAPIADNLIKNAISSSGAKKEAKAQKVQSEENAKKPLFQFTGDENFDTDSDGEDEDNAAEEDDDEDDDFENAFEVLDLARILYHKKLEAAEDQTGKGKFTELAPGLKDIKEHLADTYDLQAEISLEAERFTDAVTDLRSALELRQALFPMEDPAIAECHYKLSLALEFGAVKHDENSADGSKPVLVDEGMRTEAVTQMEKAIESCHARMYQEQKKLDSDDTLDEDKRTALKRRITNVKEIVSDMEQRVSVFPPSLSFHWSHWLNRMFSCLIYVVHLYLSSRELRSRAKACSGEYWDKSLVSPTVKSRPCSMLRQKMPMTFPLSLSGNPPASRCSPALLPPNVQPRRRKRTVNPSGSGRMTNKR